MKFYTTNFTLEVIELYKHLTCLWKTDSPEYSDFEDRFQAYQILLEKFRTAKKNATKDCVRGKIKRLRKGFKTAYFNYKVWQQDHPDATNFKTSFPYFQQLQFLAPYFEEEWQQRLGMKENRRESRSRRQRNTENAKEDVNENQDENEDGENENDNEDDADNDNLSNDGIAEDNPFNEIQEHEEFMEVESSTDMTDIKIVDVTSQKIESSQPTAPDGPETTVSEIEAEEEQEQDLVDENPPFRICCAGSIPQSDEYDKFGSFIAANLRKLNHRQSMFAQKLISNVLLNASLESLDRSSVIVKRNIVISN